jgi:hypothetical protein
VTESDDLTNYYNTTAVDNHLTNYYTKTELNNILPKGVWAEASYHYTGNNSATYEWWRRQCRELKNFVFRPQVRVPLVSLDQ